MNTDPIPATEDLIRPIHQAIERHGLTPDELVRKLKRELGAKRTVTVKVKGAVEEKKLPRDAKVIAMAEGEDETLLAIDLVDWGTRQRARMDAHKLRGDYPAERLEHSGKLEMEHSGEVNLGLAALKNKLKEIEHDG
jgi:hypothetical protein